MEALAKYPDLGTGSDLERHGVFAIVKRPRFVQNKAPKVTASDMSPAEWSADASHEWCPPGHGDLYPAMLETAGYHIRSHLMISYEAKRSGTLDKLLKKGLELKRGPDVS